MFTRSTLPGWLSERGYVTGVEVGTRLGEFASLILYGWPGKLYIVDQWLHEPSGYVDTANVSQDAQNHIMRSAINTLSSFPFRVCVIAENSISASNRFHDLQLDFVYLDANHSEAATFDDLSAWWPKIKTGGAMLGHDYLDGVDGCGTLFGVKSAVARFMSANKLSGLEVNDEPYPSFYIPK